MSARDSDRRDAERRARDATRRRPGARTRARICAVEGGRVREREDQLATEEPLEIRLAFPAPGAPVPDVVRARRTRVVAVTMRTPGNDFELAAGFLLTEGVIDDAGRIRRIRYCVDRKIDAAQRYNIVTVELRNGMPDSDSGRSLDRHFFTSSACGVCGKAGLEALALRGCRPAERGPEVLSSVIGGLPDKLRDGQGVFSATGGLHAAGLFTASGELIALREDVGRHNAVDKLIGWAALEGRLPLRDQILVVSGRSSYEIMQKAALAGVPVVCAISAPSSLAVELAANFRMTLVGFLRGDRFNIYAGGERIRIADAAAAR